MNTTRARALRSNMTDAEQRLWHHLNRRQIDKLKFRRQMPIGNFIVDFVCLERSLIIELDGGQHATQHNMLTTRNAQAGCRAKALPC